MIELEKDLQENYKRCSALTIPFVGSRLFYPITQPVVGDKPHLKQGEFIESDGKNFTVRIFGVGKFKDKAEKFYQAK